MTDRYARVLRSPDVAPLLATALLARLPIGIDGLAIVLFLREETGSFAIAGGIAGVMALGAGIGAPVLGRLIDRHGAARILLPAAVVHAVALGGLLVLGRSGAPVLPLIVVGLVSGASIPPSSSVLRSLWPTLLRAEPGLLPAAYALDSVLIELIFIGGPLMTALVVATVGPPAALLVSAAAVLAGTAAFCAQPPIRRRGPASAARTAGWLGALASPGMRTLILVKVPIGFCLGAVEVTLPAFGDAYGTAAVGGVLLAIWSLGSAAGGLAYGAREQARPLVGSFLVLLLLVPLTMLPLAAAGSVAVMAVLCVPAGLAIAPTLATANQLVSRVAPPGAATEAFTWPLTAMVAGIAAGSAAAGALAETSGWRAGVLLACAVGLLGALAAWSRRGTLAPPRVLSAA